MCNSRKAKLLSPHVLARHYCCVYVDPHLHRGITIHSKCTDIRRTRFFPVIKLPVHVNFSSKPTIVWRFHKKKKKATAMFHGFSGRRANLVNFTPSVLFANA